MFSSITMYLTLLKVLPQFQLWYHSNNSITPYDLSTINSNSTTIPLNDILLSNKSIPASSLVITPLQPQRPTLANMSERDRPPCSLTCLRMSELRNIKLLVKPPMTTWMNRIVIRMLVFEHLFVPGLLRLTADGSQQQLMTQSEPPHKGLDRTQPPFTRTVEHCHAVIQNIPQIL